MSSLPRISINKLFASKLSVHNDVANDATRGKHCPEDARVSGNCALGRI